ARRRAAAHSDRRQRVRDLKADRRHARSEGRRVAEKHAGRLLLFRKGGWCGISGAASVGGAVSHQFLRLPDHHRADRAGPSWRWPAVRAGGGGAADEPERRGADEYLRFDGYYRQPIPRESLARRALIDPVWITRPRWAG